jgi:maltose alpha-D-glucosyltransferase/alpha-amylase
MTSTSEADAAPMTAANLLVLQAQEPPPEVRDLIGGFLESARLLGQRTAELHAALAAPTDDPHFGTEPFTPHYQRGLYQSMRNAAITSFDLLRRYVADEEEEPLPEAVAVLGLRDEITKRFRRVTSRPIRSLRTRAHGDYHLGQVLYTGNDFIITDFEGEPARSLTERQIRRSPLRDVAGMLRSFNYAVHSELRERRAAGLAGGDSGGLEGWGNYWQAWVSATFLRAYLDVARGSGLLPDDNDEIELLLNVYMLEKAVYEIAYELNNRPDWLAVPLQGVLDLLQAGA